jgi:peptidoglycan/LPS O-acetylase OafA/YrhL
MGPPILLGERRIAGSLLVTGLAVLVVAGVLYGDGDYPAGHAWQSNALTVGLVLTLARPHGPSGRAYRLR